MSKKDSVPHPQNVTVYSKEETYRELNKVFADRGLSANGKTEKSAKLIPSRAEINKQARAKEVAAKGHNSKNKNGAVKNDALKPRMSLIPQLAKTEVAKVMTYGAQKYAAFNWMDGFDWTYLSDALERHVTAFNCGEDIDPESGLHHLAHAACCAMMLYEVTQIYPDRDDRWEGWQEEKGNNARTKAQEPYNPSDYLKNVLAKKTKDPREE